MLPLGHIAVTTLILYAAGLIRKRRDFILAVFGSVLPDLIDKPLGFIIFHGFGNGRLIAHTLLFNLILLATFLIFRPVLERWLGGNPVVIPLASMLHLVEDRMWGEPAVLFYPFMGSIPVKPVLTFSQRIRNILNAYHNPYIFVSEAAGSVILCFLLYVFYRKLEKI